MTAHAISLITIIHPLTRASIINHHIGKSPLSFDLWPSCINNLSSLRCHLVHLSSSRCRLVHLSSLRCHLVHLSSSRCHLVRALVAVRRSVLPCHAECYQQALGAAAAPSDDSRVLKWPSRIAWACECAERLAAVPRIAWTIARARCLTFLISASVASH